MTTINSSNSPSPETGPGTPGVPGLPGGPIRSRAAQRFIERTKLLAVLLALMLPTLAGMIVLDYYPKISAVRYSFYTWDGSMTEEFRGLKNYQDAFTADPLFWQTFGLIGILLAANFVKMWPSIFTAVALHRIRSERSQYLYRVLFVIPMVIPGLVWLLIWKSFFDPTVGLLNAFLQNTGLMTVLQRLDTIMPAVAGALQPVVSATANPLFGGLWAMALIGVMLASATAGLRGVRTAWFWWLLLLAAGLLVWSPYSAGSGGINVGGLIRMIVAFGAVILGAELLKRRTILAAEILTWAGVLTTVTAVVFMLLTMVWSTPTGAFVTGQPAWLGHTKLVIPAILFWGFPWVGTVGVLIYLAGLQNISTDVYEAAELDGLGPIGRLWYIELPLMMTQIRINLIFMTIGTLTDYGLFLILLGPEGGPGNKGMTPGLYMYREAFFNQRYGYACALGMVLFVIVLGITIFYQKYVKVEK
jgi:ABC-type sugar transport system permease subunit